MLVNEGLRLEKEGRGGGVEISWLGSIEDFSVYGNYFGYLAYACFYSRQDVGIGKLSPV